MITVTILTKNSEETIGASLESLAGFNEIIILDKKIVEIKDIETKKKQLQEKINLIQPFQSKILILKH